MANKEAIMKFHKLHKEFKDLTGYTVPYDVWGIDIVELDKKLGTAKLDGISMEQYLTDKFGKRASDIIDEMIPLTFL